MPHRIPRPPSSITRDLGQYASRGAIHERDQVPPIVLKLQGWLYDWLSGESRFILGSVIVIMLIVVVAVLASMRFLHVVFEGLDTLALVGLFLINWIGNGGVLVPIPGARFLGLLVIFQQAVMLPSWEVFAVSGAAMALGLTTYYIAGARTAQSYVAGDADGAIHLAEEAGMLDEQPEFQPGAALGDEAAMTIAEGRTRRSAAATDPLGDAGDEGEAAGGPDAKTLDVTAAADDGRLGALRARFTSSLAKTQERVSPIIDRRGMEGMFILCFGPSPMATAAAYLGGLMRFGFRRYLLASFAAKYLLAGVVVVLALTFGDTARAVSFPSITIPLVNVTIFPGDDDASPAPSPSAAAVTVVFPDGPQATF